MIVFVSDNGFRPDRARHARQNTRSKLSQFEDGIRTPVLIRWDGTTQFADHPQRVHTIDIVPTVLAAVGLTGRVTPRMHGRNLWPSATGEAPLSDRAVFGAIYPNDAQVLGRPSQHVRGKWVLQGDLKFVRPGPAMPPLPLSLFDLQSDPDERNNLIATAKYADRVEELQQLLDQWWPEGDDSRVTQPSGGQHE